MPKGWDQSLDHGIQDDEIHVLSFDIIEEFFDNLLESTKFVENRDALEGVLFAKYEDCPDCESTKLDFMLLYSCPMRMDEPYDNLTDETLDIFEFCENCANTKLGCSEFSRQMDVICSTCGWVKDDDYHRLNPCSQVQILGFYTEECDDCGEPHKCDNYKKLVEEGKIIDRTEMVETQTTVEEF